MPTKKQLPPERRPFDQGAMEGAIRSFLEAAGLDPAAPHLSDTPTNVAEAWRDAFLDGYDCDPKELFRSTYPVEDADSGSGMVLLKDVAFHGMCPHHLLPFHGKAHVAYIPRTRLASLSALARLVDCFAHRLEIQETVTRQIAQSLMRDLDARGAAVSLETDQACMTTRGVERKGSRAVTYEYAGELAARSELRNEFLRSLRAPE